MSVLATRSGSWRIDQLGFTLIELITTLVIIGIISAIAAPRLFDNREFSERGYIDEISSAFRYAQRVAIASNCHVSVTIDSMGYVARLRANEGACDSESGAFSVPIMRGDGTPLSGSRPSDVSFSGSGTIIFARDGSIANGIPPLFSAGPFTLSLDRETGAVIVTP